MQSITVFVGFLIFFYQVNVIETQTVDIVQTAINNGNFKTLAAALAAADLVTPLKGNGPFTVFAPTDAAFNKLPAGTIDNLLKPENKGKLSQILTYHVISGTSLTSSQIKALPLPTQVKTLEGNNITVSTNGTYLQVNNANVIIPDVLATNGIIHVIDTVLMPPAGNLTTSASLNQSLSLTLLLTIVFSYICFL